MAYAGTFYATDDADWVEAIKIIDDDTGLALEDATDADFNLEVKDCDTTLLSASTDDATITKPADNVIRWRFTVDQLGSLCPGNTYVVGITMTIDGGQVVQLLTGSLVFKDGGL